VDLTSVADTRLAFCALFALLALERLAELGLARRNIAWARREGALVIGEPVVWPAMVVLHALFLVVPPLEVWLAERPFVPALAWPALLLASAAMALRYWAIATLGRHWSPRVVVVPGRPLLTGGPYRHLRHPNYLAVVIELVALPLVHGAWASALAFSVANAILLRRRIRTEEAALRTDDVRETSLGDRPRFIPRGWR
jgi:methyltransferase